VFDLLIVGGRLVDGTGNPWYRADIAVRDGQIVAIGHLRGALARRTINADGLVVSPGFIDVHVHSDVMLLAEPEHEGQVRQGVTTELLGQDGMSYAPVSPETLPFWREYLAGVGGAPDIDWSWQTVGEYLARFDRQVAVNVAYLIPHGNVRYEVMRMEQRPPTPEELARMQSLVAQGMADGAVGLSTGLFYVPGVYANTDELIALCRPVAEAGGVYVTHMRDYGAHYRESLAEVFTIGREAHLPVHISHLNLRAEALPLIDQAREAGIEVTFDTYPYLAGCTLLVALLPTWVQEGGIRATVARLRQPEVRARLRQTVEAPTARWDLVTIAVVTKPEHQPYGGMTIPDAARLARQDLTDFIADLLVSENLAVTIIAHHAYRTEEDMRAILRHRAQMVGTDGVLLGTHPHPRGFGTYPRLLGRYVREEEVLELEECVRKMTSLPAQLIGLQGRGLLREGFAADIVCFDPNVVIDRATYEEGRRPPDGIPYVMVNGVLVVDGEKHTGALPGRSLKPRLAPKRMK